MAQVPGRVLNEGGRLGGHASHRPKEARNYHAFFFCACFPFFFLRTRVAIASAAARNSNSSYSTATHQRPPRVCRAHGPAPLQAGHGAGCLHHPKLELSGFKATKYTMQRARVPVRSLAVQASNKATLFDTEGCDGYSDACDAANPERTPALPKARRQLEEMEEKPLSHGMFAIILSCNCLLSNMPMFLEV